MDRFRYGLNGGDATAGRFTASQAAITDLPGFGFAHKLDCTTADTSIAHLSATLEKKTWIALPFICDWRWFLNNEKSIWYEHVNLYRQKINGNWDEVFCKIKNDLKKFF